MVEVLILLNVVCISFALWGVGSVLHKIEARLKSLDENFQLFIKIYLTGGKD